MKRIIGILFIVLGIVVSSLFFLIILNQFMEYVQYGYMEWDFLFKCSVLLLFGFGWIFIGSYFLKQPKKKNSFLFTQNGRTFMKMGGDYEVGFKPYIRFLFLTVTMFWSILFSGLEVSLYKEGNSLDPFILFLFSMITCFFILNTYFIYRPRILVRGNNIVCYPRWGRKRSVEITEITERKLEKDIFFLFNKKIYVTYFVCGKELISFSMTRRNGTYTSLIDNATRFDINVFHLMKQKEHGN